LPVAILCAQQPQTFEAVSIRLNHSGDSNTQINRLPGGRLVMVNATLKTLVRNAYGLLSFQFAGEAGWWDSDKYDISAVIRQPEQISDAQLKPLLQTLLRDRFHLEVHWETKEGSIYALVTDKGGPKFLPYNGAPGYGMNTQKTPGRVHMKGTDVPMSELAGNLANQLGRWVTDETGLTGRYDFAVEWDPQQTADTTGPSLFTALKDQLGLQLKPERGPVKLLVIDHAEKPTDN
jgi:uncharacterized protein (TIGR03435 family)